VTSDDGPQIPPYTGGLLPLSFGLFHQQEGVRDINFGLFYQQEVVRDIKFGLFHQQEEVRDINLGLFHQQEEVLDINFGLFHQQEEVRDLRLSFHTAPHVSREFIDHTLFRRSHLDECVHAGWCAVSTSAQSFSTRRARVARQQRHVHDYPI